MLTTVKANMEKAQDILTFCKKRMKSLEKQLKKSNHMAHYVNNKALLECIEKYQKQKNEAIQNNTALPKIPEYFGEAIIQIATRFSRRSNFIGYSFRDEMISDAIEHALVAVDKFDANKSSNPFSYITTMVYYSFIRRIAKRSVSRISEAS